MSEENEIISKVPELTPELLEENEELQKKWREKFVYAPITNDKYAEMVVKDNLKTLDAMEEQTQKADGEFKRDLEAKIKQIRIDTTEWLRNLGNFALAEDLAPTDELKEYYSDLITAVEKDDSDWCHCPKWKDGNQNYYEEFKFFSHKHGKKISMVKCRLCGFRNAFSKPSDLQKLSAHRAECVKASETGEKVEVKSLSEILR